MSRCNPAFVDRAHRILDRREAFSEGPPGVELGEIIHREPACFAHDQSQRVS